MNKIRPYALIFLVVLITTAICIGCTKKNKDTLEGTSGNDILTFANNEANKPVIKVGVQYYLADTKIVDALNKRFPEYLFVMDYSAAAGIDSSKWLADVLDRENSFDLIILGNINSATSREEEYLVDLSAEDFLNNYLLSALNKVSINGHVYFIPGPSTLSGIVFNVDMFKEYGWQIPNNFDEFMSLCQEIRTKDITPFVSCLKYDGQLNRLFGMMNYNLLYQAKNNILWSNEMQTGKAHFKGHMEPFFESAKAMYEAELISTEDFSASLTKQRQDFWAGKYAMIEYDSAIYSYAETENAPFEIGIMPYPSKNSEESGFAIAPEFCIAIPKGVEKNKERLELMKEVLTYLSSEEGQNTMLEGSLRVSNVKGVDLKDNPAMKYAKTAYDRGNLYPIITYNLSNLPIYQLQQEAVKAICEGASVEEAIDIVDQGIAKARQIKQEVKTYEVIATAEEDFTMLETSYYLADQLRKETNADIGLMIDRGFFKSNLATIQKGEITSELTRFVMKNMSAEDYLTTYQLTGAQLRELLEKPIVNEIEFDAFIAASGLNIEYAPWNERGKRIIKLTLEDGTELVEDKLYTVAAYAGVIDERYISSTVAVYEEAGQLADVVEKAFRRDKTLRPNIKDRVTLIWPKVK